MTRYDHKGFSPQMRETVDPSYFHLQGKHMAATHPTSYQLGTPTSAHRASLGVWLSLVLGTGFVLLSIYSLIALVRSGVRLQLNGPLFWCLFGLGLGVILLAVWYYQVSLKIQIFEQGFIYSKGSATSVIRWDDIESVQQQIIKQSVNFIPVGTSYAFTICTVGGETLKLTNSVGKVAQLGALIQNETFKRLMPRAIETYNGGGTLRYGRLSVNQAGISNGKETIPWVQVKGIQISNGFIVVKKEGKWLTWANVSVAQTPNFFIFLALVDRIVGVR
jgi:hypothetical protein